MPKGELTGHYQCVFCNKITAKMEEDLGIWQMGCSNCKAHGPYVPTKGLCELLWNRLNCAKREYEYRAMAEGYDKDPLESPAIALRIDGAIGQW